MGRDVTGGIPGIEDEHASGIRVARTRRGGRRTSDGAESLVDTSIRQRRAGRRRGVAEVTEVQVQV
ncbi:hypothetical protein DWC19_12980 [Streptomyces sp. M7]|nr:hypothetical protein DC008_06570 [Streptomyces nigra]RDS64911.1 hypothetical protein DWC19_12980 [Streptomyces sp. M7]